MKKANLSRRAFWERSEYLNGGDKALLTSILKTASPWLCPQSQAFVAMTRSRDLAGWATLRTDQRTGPSSVPPRRTAATPNPP